MVLSTAFSPFPDHFADFASLAGPMQESCVVKWEKLLLMRKTVVLTALILTQLIGSYQEVHGSARCEMTSCDDACNAHQHTDMN